MTTERLYDIIKTWRDSVTAEGMITTGAEMNNVLKQLEADMLIEQSKKSGTKSIVTAANRIIARFSVLDDTICRSYNRLSARFLGFLNEHIGFKRFEDIQHFILHHKKSFIMNPDAPRFDNVIQFFSGHSYLPLAFLSVLKSTNLL